MTDTWRALFDRYPAAVRPTTPLEPLGNAGGMSGARLFRYRSELGPLVARLWPVEGGDPARIGQIHAWLAKAGTLSFVPVPIRTLAGPSVVMLGGRAWEIAPWLPGTADPSRHPSHPRLFEAFGRLADFLSRLGDERIEATCPGLAIRVAELEALIHWGFEEIRLRAARAVDDPASTPALLWVDRAIALAPPVLEATRRSAARPLPLQPCLRDARPDHFLFQGDRLAGLVDFGAMGRDSVVGDLARLLAEWVGPDRQAARVALEAFESIRPLSEAELRAMYALSRANALLMAARWARWHFLEGRTFEGAGAVVRGLTRGLARIDEGTWW